MSANADVLRPTAMHAPSDGWDDRLPRSKRNWWVFFWVYSLVMIIIAGAWFFVEANHEIPMKNQAVTPEAYQKLVDDFAQKHGATTASPVAKVLQGGDVFVEGRMWGWYPTLELKAGQTYTIWLSSVDVDHTFSVGPQHLMFDVIPGHMYGVTITPDTPGTFLVYCAEYCGVGHQDMATRLIVDP